MFKLFEKWIDINGFEENYQVSNYGRVRSMDRIEKNKIGVERKLIGSIRKTYYDKNSGYEMVTLSKANKNKCVLVHLLVANAFMENPNSYKQVNHKNGNKKNNKKSNLEWCSPRENTHHARRRMKSTSKFVGVSFDYCNEKKPWMSRITMNGVTKFLGRFETEEMAHAAYLTECDDNNIKIRVL